MVRWTPHKPLIYFFILQNLDLRWTGGGGANSIRSIALIGFDCFFDFVVGAAPKRTFQEKCRNYFLYNIHQKEIVQNFNT